MSEEALRVDDQRRNQLIEDFVDFLLPLLKPYEATIYLYLLRRSHFGAGSSKVRVGKRTIAADLGQGTRATRSNFQHITELLKALEAKGCISIGDTTRDGTLYTVRLPSEVPAVKERVAARQVTAQPLNYYRDPTLRNRLFERDKWTCRYCGEPVSAENVTLDHLVPISQGGADSPENLVTCCLICNAIKSGKTYEEAAPAILASLRERRLRG